jgi:putative ABC transport system permease protein
MPVGVVGCVLALPLVIRPLLRLAALVVRWPLGLEGRLALRQLQRRPIRVSLTVGILAIALFVGIGVGHALLASVRDARDWTEHVVTTDFYLRGTQPDGAYAITMAVLPEELDADIAAVEGVSRVDKLNWILGRAQGERIVVIASTFALDRPPPIHLADGDSWDIGRRLREGEVVIGTALARRLHLAIGDRIPLDTRRGPQSLTVAGTANEYTIDGMAIIMDRQVAQRLLGFQGAHVFLVTAQPGQASTLATNLRKFCADHHLLLQSGQELRQYVDQAVEGFAGLVWALLALVFVVASLAIVNTLTMNVLEQTRELGVLRAVGLRRCQVRKLVLAQALAVGLMCLLPGVAVGLILAYVFNLLSDLLLAHAVGFRVEIHLVLACAAAAVSVAVLAALLPARRAGRLQVVTALQYE